MKRTFHVTIDWRTEVSIAAESPETARDRAILEFDALDFLSLPTIKSFEVTEEPSPEHAIFLVESVKTGMPAFAAKSRSSAEEFLRSIKMDEAFRVLLVPIL